MSIEAYEEMLDTISADMAIAQAETEPAANTDATLRWRRVLFLFSGHVGNRDSPFVETLIGGDVTGNTPHTAP